MKRCVVIAAVLLSASLGGGRAAGQGKQPAKQPPLQFLEEKKFEIKRHIRCAAFSPDGKLLALGEDDVHLWDVSGETPAEFAIFRTRVGLGLRSVQFSPDGKFLVCGGADNNVRVWDVASRTEVFVGKSHRGDVCSIAFAPDGKTIATGSNDKTAILWDLANDGKLNERTVIKAEDKFGAAVKSVVFAAGKQAPVLVTGSSNGTFRAYTWGPPG